MMNELTNRVRVLLVLAPRDPSYEASRCLVGVDSTLIFQPFVYNAPRGPKHTLY